MAANRQLQEAVGRLVANADAVHSGQIEWDTFSRRNRSIWNEVHAQGDKFTRQVSEALQRVKWK